MNASDSSDETEQGSGGLDKSCRRQPEIGWYNLPRTWQTCCFDPFSWHPHSPACSKMPFESPSQTQKSTRGSAVSGAKHGVPHKDNANFWEKQVRKAKITSYMSNVSWKIFKFLLPAASEARNKTSHHPEEQHNCGLPAHSWGQAAHTCPGCSCCHEEHGSVPALGATFAASSASGQQRCAQVPHTSAGRWFTRAVDHSHHSEVSCKQLPTDLKNYPMYLHPSHRYRGRWVKPICSLDDPMDVLKSTHSITAISFVQNREFGNFRIRCKKQSLHLLSSLLWRFSSAHCISISSFTFPLSHQMHIKIKPYY